MPAEKISLTATYITMQKVKNTISKDYNKLL